MKEMTVTAFARAIGVHRRTAQNWARSGRVKARQTDGGHWRIDAREVKRLPMSLPAFAAEIGASERTVRYWAQTGKIKARQARGGGDWLFDRRAIPRGRELAETAKRRRANDAD